MSTVTCDEVRASFRGGRVPTGPEVSAHVETCADCAVLFEQEAVAGRALGRWEPLEPADLSRVRQELQRRLGAERGPRAWLRSRRTSTRVALAVAGAAGLVAVASRESHRPPVPEGETVASGVSLAAACFSYGSLFTALFLVLLWALSRRDGPSVRSAALAGLGSAAVGILGLSAHCPSSDPMHLLAGHASVLVAWVAACALLARAKQLREGPR
jgi:hypothetical protein